MMPLKGDLGLPHTSLLLRLAQLANEESIIHALRLISDQTFRAIATLVVVQILLYPIGVHISLNSSFFDWRSLSRASYV
jgi:hypothetical protein